MIRARRQGLPALMCRPIPKPRSRFRFGPAHLERERERAINQPDGSGPSMGTSKTQPRHQVSSGADWFKSVRPGGYSTMADVWSGVAEFGGRRAETIPDLLLGVIFQQFLSHRLRRLVRRGIARRAFLGGVSWRPPNSARFGSSRPGSGQTLGPSRQRSAALGMNRAKLEQQHQATRHHISPDSGADIDRCWPKLATPTSIRAEIDRGNIGPLTCPSMAISTKVGRCRPRSAKSFAQIVRAHISTGSNSGHCVFSKTGLLWPNPAKFGKAFANRRMQASSVRAACVGTTKAER